MKPKKTDMIGKVSVIGRVHSSDRLDNSHRMHCSVLFFKSDAGSFSKAEFADIRNFSWNNQLLGEVYLHGGVHGTCV
jgi:hypothetical protein